MLGFPFAIVRILKRCSNIKWSLFLNYIIEDFAEILQSLLNVQKLFNRVPMNQARSRTVILYRQFDGVSTGE